MLNIHWKDWYWNWNSNTLATWSEELTHWKRPWCWERLTAGEGDDRIRWLDGITNSMDMSLSKLGDNEGQGSLVYCSPWGCKESDTTEWLKNNKCFRIIFYISCPSPKMNHFLEEHWFLLLQNDNRNQDLGAGRTPCYQTSLLLGSLS